MPNRTYGAPMGPQQRVQTNDRPKAGPAQGDALTRAYNTHMQQAHDHFVNTVRNNAQQRVPRGSSAPTLRSAMPTGLRGRQLEAQIKKEGG